MRWKSQPVPTPSACTPAVPMPGMPLPAAAQPVLPHPTPLAQATAAPAARRLRMALGTWLAIEAAADSAERAAQAIESAFEAVQEVDRLMHPHRTGSDLAAIRAAPSGTRLTLDRSTGEVLCLARALHYQSEGVFDPCVAAGTDNRAAAARPGSFADLQIDASNTSKPVVVCRAPLHLDLGGIAKGYAVDRAIEALRAAGCSSGLVNAGGDLRVFGPNAQTLFVRRGSEVHRIELREAALAVSDADAQRRPSEHRGYYVGSSTNPRLTCRYAAVMAPRAAIADALTKCVLLCSRETAARALEHFGAHLLTFGAAR